MDWDFSLVLTVIVIGIIIFLPIILPPKGKGKYRCLIYTALNHDDYFKVTGRLHSTGIKYNAKVRMNSGQHTSSSFSTAHDYTQYDIYVSKEDEHRAQHAIHR
jgi:hypothetical protein